MIASLRWLWCMVCATTYQIATNPFVMAALLAPIGHWPAAFAITGGWLAVGALAVALSVTRTSRLVPGRLIVTAPDWLFLLGNEQEGNDPDWYQAMHPDWPWWLRAFVFSVWRNKLRNLPFVSCLAWLHRPRGELRTTESRVGSIRLRLRMRGWMTEFEYVVGRRFGDFGPRLDQPDEWGGVSWAFRPWGRF